MVQSQADLAVLKEEMAGKTGWRIGRNAQAGRSVSQAVCLKKSVLHGTEVLAPRV